MIETFSAFAEDNKAELGKVFACTSSKSGAGKSTIAYLTSIMIQETTQAAANRGFRHSGAKVCLIDLELSTGQISALTGARMPSVTAIDNLSTITAESVSKALTVDTETGISLLLAPPKAKDFLIYTPTVYKKIIETLQTMFDVIVLNVSEEYGDNDYAKVAYDLADKVIVTTSVKPGSIYGLTRWIDTAVAPAENNGYGIQKEDLYVVLNQIDGNIPTDLETNMSEITAGVKIVTAVPESDALLKALGTKEVRRLLLHDVTVSNPIFFIVASLLNTEIIVNPLTS